MKIIQYLPVTFRAKVMNRKTPPTSFCWDVTMLGKYWDCFEDNQPRFYHHTGPVNQVTENTHHRGKYHCTP